jgi:hypothetical protein
MLVLYISIYMSIFITVILYPSPGIIVLKSNMSASLYKGPPQGGDKKTASAYVCV